jgi:hypothetical protein
MCLSTSRTIVSTSRWRRMMAAQCGINPGPDFRLIVDGRSGLAEFPVLESWSK